MTDPTTAAGRALLEDGGGYRSWTLYEPIRERMAARILAIEAEAGVAALEAAGLDTAEPERLLAALVEELRLGSDGGLMATSAAVSTYQAARAYLASPSSPSSPASSPTAAEEEG